MKKVFALGAMVILLAGCTASDTPGETPTPEPSKSASATSEAIPTPIPTVTPAADGMAFCEEYTSELSPYADFLLSATSGNVDMAEYERLSPYFEQLETLAPAKARPYLADYADPMYQMKEVVEAGGGSLTLTTSNFKQGTADLMTYCAEDIGYRVN